MSTKCKSWCVAHKTIHDNELRQAAQYFAVVQFVHHDVSHRLSSLKFKLSLLYFCYATVQHMIPRARCQRTQTQTAPHFSVLCRLISSASHFHNHLIVLTSTGCDTVLP